MRSAVKITRSTEVWHHWFAWYPIRVKSGNMVRWVWWETVERKLIPGYDGSTAEYRLLP